jgi:3-deoxy-D-manno-octulosonic-acid transferase
MAYRGVSSIAGLFARGYLESRARKGKEDPARLGERFGTYAQARPAGTLIWMHAASVGESGVALALIDALAAREPSLSFLLSTGTRTSADLVARRAPPRTTHIYAPLDRIDAVRKFYTHWRPTLGVLLESELWPNLILEAEARDVTMFLVNARMSSRSLKRWLRWRAAGERLVHAFGWIAAADTQTAAALTDLRKSTVANLGNLKLAAPPLHVDAAARAALAAEIGARPVWLAASTHPGEDEIALAAHARIRAQSPNALLIIVPRHPERGAAIARLADGAPQRSRDASFADAPVYIADTLGELGTLYDLVPVSLVAGSLLPSLKGHNPIEPAKLGSAIITGPYVESFRDVFDALFEAGGATKANGADELSATVERLWRDEAARTRQCEAARDVASRGARAFTDTVTLIWARLPEDVAAKAANAPA